MSEFDLDDALSNLDSEDSEISAEDGGGEGIDLDAELSGMEIGEGESSADGDGEGIELDSDLEAAFSDDGHSDDGGEVLDIEAELGALEEQAGGLTGSGSTAPAGYSEDSVNIEFLLDIKLHVTFEVGRSKMLVSDLLTLGQGSVIELHRLVGDELDLFVNGKLVARGEVVVVNEKFGCRITNIVPPEERVKYLAEY